MYRLLLIILSALYMTQANAQPKTDEALIEILSSDKHPLFMEVLNHPQVYRLQIIYTQIDRDKNNRPSFRNYYFNYDPQLYFNPASVVKLPLAFLSLEKIHEISHPAVNRHSTIVFDTSEKWHRPLYHDSTARSGRPSIAHFIKRALLISENDPYNRMYQFLGQQYINSKLHEKGYQDARITRQFMGLTTEQNRITNPVRFLDAQGRTVYSQPALSNTDSFDFSRIIKLGNAHMNSRDSIVHEPFDFTKHNNLSLLSVQQMLQSVMFPQSVPEKQRFRLTAGDYTFLYRYLSQYPSETPDPKYDEQKFYDSYVKFFFRDSTQAMPDGVRVFNKVGWSYGFLTDVSYVADFNNHIEYMLAATLYVNSDGILNDGKYEYQSMGYPFLRRLGQVIYDHERNRIRKYRPDLNAFRITYEQRDPADTRAPLKDVDN